MHRLSTWFFHRNDELFLEMYKVGLPNYSPRASLTSVFNVQRAIQYSNIDPALVQDICVGTVLTPESMYPARTAALAAGFPESTAVQTINRFCSSGLMAVTDIANKVRVGQIEIGLALGIESMSQK